MSKSTKIVATISDLRCEVDFIRELYNEGINVVRMNSAHLQREGFERIVNNTRAVSKNIAILMDTKGPEIRTTKVENDSRIKSTSQRKALMVATIVVDLDRKIYYYFSLKFTT